MLLMARKYLSLSTSMGHPVTGNPAINLKFSFIVSKSTNSCCSVFVFIVAVVRIYKTNPGGLPRVRL